MVADSALYSQENLKIMEDLNWITRVPLIVKKAKELIQSVSIESIEDLENIKPEERELEEYFDSSIFSRLNTLILRFSNPYYKKYCLKNTDFYCQIEYSWL